MEELFKKKPITFEEELTKKLGLVRVGGSLEEKDYNRLEKVCEAFKDKAGRADVFRLVVNGGLDLAERCLAERKQA